ncbi:MAG: hypothetical protein Q4F00_09395 [bacterium]|nr:hypothetical protein [bacterium]
MRLLFTAKYFIASALTGLLLSVPLHAAPSHLRYPENLSWRLITEREIKRFTNCPEMPGYEKTHALPIFSQPLAPLSGVQVAPNGQLPLETPATTWKVAPFPYIAPPDKDSGWQPAVAGTVIAGQAPPSPRPAQEPQNAIAPAAFSEVLASDTPSAALRPRARTAGEQLLSPADRLPEPFSLRRYSTDKHGFFQIALYSGYSSIKAEIAYKTLRTASPNRQAVSGLGSEAFLSLVELPPDPNAETERNRDKTLTLESFDNAEKAEMSFSGIAPEGSQRFDLTDTAFIKARQAPFFNDVPISAASLTEDLPSSLPEALRSLGNPAFNRQDSSAKSEMRTGTAPTAPPASLSNNQADSKELPLPAAAPAPLAVNSDGTPAVSDDAALNAAPSPFTGSNAAETDEEEIADPFSERPDLSGKKDNSVLVLIVHYPEKDTVLELAMDTRMGNLQSLIAMAYLIQGRLLNRW